MERLNTIERAIFLTLLFFKVTLVSLKKAKNLAGIQKIYEAFLINKSSKKSYTPRSTIYKIAGRNFWNINIPGFPSKAFDYSLEKEIDSILNCGNSSIVTAVFAITKKCSLNCEHCFEWNIINNRESLSEYHINQIIEGLIKLKVGQIILSGGEPLNRYIQLIEIIRKYSINSIDFWINTSANNLNTHRIKELKFAGSTGIIFSLDHFSKQEHDKFRGMSGSYHQVIESIKASREANLVTALSLCATNEFVSLNNLIKYIDLSKQLGVAFIQFLEPKSVGRYASGKAELSKQNIIILETFFENYNSYIEDRNDDPILIYPDYNKRRYGCIGGQKYIYINTDGKISPCPFCDSTGLSLNDFREYSLKRTVICDGCKI